MSICSRSYSCAGFRCLKASRAGQKEVAHLALQWRRTSSRRRRDESCQQYQCGLKHGADSATRCCQQYQCGLKHGAESATWCCQQYQCGLKHGADSATWCCQQYQCGLKHGADSATSPSLLREPVPKRRRNEVFTSPLRQMLLGSQLTSRYGLRRAQAETAH